MHIPSRIKMMGGSAAIPIGRPMVPVHLTQNEIHILSRAINLEAVAAEAEGNTEIADRLATRAAALREAAR